MPWHTDLCHRFSVVVRSEQLRIEYRDTGERILLNVQPGLADWNKPGLHVQRAVNMGSIMYEEVVMFFLDCPDIEPQPKYP